MKAPLWKANLMYHTQFADHLAVQNSSGVDFQSCVLLPEGQNAENPEDVFFTL